MIVNLRRTALVAAALGAAMLWTAPVRAADEVTADKVRVAYLYNFLKFVRWPEDNRDTFDLCVSGAPDLAQDAAAILVGRTARERDVRVAALGSGGFPECHIVYFAGSALPDSFAWGRALTVGEGREFVRAGGMIGFVRVGENVRFYVNLGAIRAAGLQADAQLLSVALEVLR